MTCLLLWVKGVRAVTGLVWTVMRRHLRRLVVAHNIHGRQMRGYFARGARTLADIDEANANMRMETAFDNYAVHNFDEAAINEIRTYTDS